MTPNRRAFFLSLATAIFGQRLATKWWPRPTGGLFDPIANIAAQYRSFRPRNWGSLGENPGMKIGDTISIRGPIRLLAHDGPYYPKGEAPVREFIITAHVSSGPVLHPRGSYSTYDRRSLMKSGRTSHRCLQANDDLPHGNAECERCNAVHS